MRKWIVAVLVTLALSGCAKRRGGYPPPGKAAPGGYAVDAGGRPIRDLESGSSLHFGARKMQPNTMYEFRVAIGDQPASTLENAVSFARSATDREGNIPPVVLWYESGVVGCSDRPELGTRPFVFKSFDEAEHSRGQVVDDLGP